MLQRLKQEEQELSNWHSDLRTRNTREEKNNHSEWSAGLKTRSARDIPQKKSFDTWGAVKESAKDALRKTAQIPRNVAAGAGDILDLPIMAANYGLRSAGVNSQIPHVGQGIAEGIDTLTGGYTRPHTSDERSTEAVTRAVSSIPTGALAGAKLAATGIKGVSKLGRGLQKINPIEGTNIAGTGAGALAAHSYNESNPEDFVGTLGTGLAADMATRTAMGLANKRNWANVLKINPKAAESFKEMEINPTLGQVSDNPLVKRAENTLKSIGFSSKLRNINDEQYKKMLEIIGPGAQGLAPSELEAGKAIRKSLTEYGNKGSRVTNKLKENYLTKVEKAPHDEIPVYDSLNFVDKLLQDLKTKESKSDFLKSPLGKNYTSLAKRAAEKNHTVPLSDLLEFRTNLYDEISKGELGSVSRARLTQLRAKINEDIDDYMKGIGAFNEWKRYGNFYSNWASKRKPHIVEAKDVPEFEANKIFDSIGHSGKLDRSLLDTVITSQKKSTQNQTTDALFQKMGKNGNNYDVHLFAKRFSAQPKETQDLLLNSRPEPARKKLKAVIHSIDTIKDLAKFGNPSGTAYTEALIKSGQIGAVAAYDLAVGNSLPDAAWHYALLAAGSSALSRGMFTNPRFINWAIKGAQLSPKARVHHIGGIKGILGRPVYQAIKNSLAGQEQEN